MSVDIDLDQDTRVALLIVRGDLTPREAPVVSGAIAGLVARDGYDVWVPMGYWTNRKPDSEYRDAYRYTTENVRLLRENLNDPDAIVHVAGGVGTKATSNDYERFVKGAHDSRSVGLSVYDWAVTARSAYAILRKGPR